MSFFVECEPSRSSFQSMLTTLYNEVNKNREERRSTLSGKDIALLRNAEGGLVYLATMFDREWKICLPIIVANYIDRMNEILRGTHSTLEPECTASTDYLSIIDVQIILEDTDDIIYYLKTNFDANRYRQQRSFFERVSGYLNSIRAEDDGALVRRIPEMSEVSQ
jgi:hypothetical protein